MVHAPAVKSVESENADSCLCGFFCNFSARSFLAFLLAAIALASPLARGAELAVSGSDSSALASDDALIQLANSQLQLSQYDDATRTFQTLLARKPKPETAAVAEFGIATALKESGKLDAAIAAFKKVRDECAGLPQAEQAAYWAGQLALQQGDFATAVSAFTGFLSKFPKSALEPSAKFSLAQALLATDGKAAAFALFTEVAEKFPSSQPAPFTYFQRASILESEQKTDESLALMKEFIKRFPDDDKVFYAYDAIGQNEIAAEKPLEAIGTYLQMAEKRPSDPLAARAWLAASQLWLEHAEQQGAFTELSDAQRAEWNKGVSNSVAAAEKLLDGFPESTQVPAALDVLFADEKLLSNAQLKTADEIAASVESLAEKAEAHPAAKSKILFKLARFIYEMDKPKGLQIMSAAYNPRLVYEPETLDQYGAALLEAGEAGQALAIYQKLAADYPNPACLALEKAPPQIQLAQAAALFGEGKALQKLGKTAESGGTFHRLRRHYPKCPKLAELDFELAESLFQQKKDGEAADLLVPLISSTNGSAELHANAMLLLGSVHERRNELAAAINQYFKLDALYQGVPGAASEALWRGAQLLEKQAAELGRAREAGAREENPPGEIPITKEGQLQKAIQAYQDLVEKYPHSPHLPEAKARLALLNPNPKK